MSTKKTGITQRLTFDKKVYPLSAILHTCNLYGEKASFKTQENGTEFIVVAAMKKSASGGKLEELTEEFQNELNSQTLRLRVAKENKKIRERIIEQALCSSFPRPEGQGRAGGIPEQTQSGEEPVCEEEIDKELEQILKEVEAEDYQSDPLGIAIPWEEKYGKETESVEGGGAEKK